MVATKIKGNLQSLMVVLWSALLFSMIFVPRTFSSIKMVILGILLFVIFLLIGGQIVQYCGKTIIGFTVLRLGYGILLIGVGIVRKNAVVALVDSFRLNIIYILIFSVAIMVIHKKEQFWRIIQVVLFAGCAVAIYSILFLLTNMGIWPERLFFVLSDGGVGIHEGYTHLTNASLSSLVFLVPFVDVLFVTGYSNEIISRRLIVFTQVLVAIACIISGRRILWLVLIAPLVCALLIRRGISSWNHLKRLIAIPLIVVIGIVFLQSSSVFAMDNIIERFIEAFANNSENVRIGQMVALWEGFLKSPLLGSGAGAYIAEYIRSESFPWVYEMTYNYVLFAGGIIGMTLYAGSLGTIFFSLVKIIQSNKEGKFMQCAVMYGFISAIIANATNPYFDSSFDFFWFLYLPLMYINMTEVNKKEVEEFEVNVC